MVFWHDRPECSEKQAANQRSMAAEEALYRASEGQGCTAKIIHKETRLQNGVGQAGVPQVLFQDRLPINGFHVLWTFGAESRAIDEVWAMTGLRGRPDDIRTEADFLVHPQLPEVLHAEDPGSQVHRFNKGTPVRQVALHQVRPMPLESLGPGTRRITCEGMYSTPGIEQGANHLPALISCGANYKYGSLACQVHHSESREQAEDCSLVRQKIRRLAGLILSGWFCGFRTLHGYFRRPTSQNDCFGKTLAL